MGLLQLSAFSFKNCQFLFWWKDHLEEDQKSLFSFLEKSGHLTPKGLEIPVSKPKPDQPVMVRILLDPSRQILPFGEKIELKLKWRAGRRLAD